MSMPVTFISFDVLTEFIFGEECHKLLKIYGKTSEIQQINAI